MGARRQGVERGEELAVADQPLKHDSRQVVEGRCANVRQFRSRLDQTIQDSRRVAIRDPLKEVARDLEDRPVVDLQNVPPTVEDLDLRRLSPGTPQRAGILDVVLASDGGLKDEGVEQDRHRHPGGLFPFLLAKAIS